MGWMICRYEVLSHTADSGLVAYGSTLEELFENAAFGMFDLMFDLGEAPPSTVETPVSARGESLEDLLVNWLGEWLFESESRELAFSSFSVARLEEGSVWGSASGVPVGEIELRGPPIKAVTYHDLAVERTPEGWRARIVFDV